MEEDIERMLVCEVCGAEACFGFGVTIDGLRMGDFGSWRCENHHPEPERQIRYTREEWAEIRDAATPATPAAPAREDA
jgi:hypothetical protein